MKRIAMTTLALATAFACPLMAQDNTAPTPTPAAAPAPAPAPTPAQEPQPAPAAAPATGVPAAPPQMTAEQAAMMEAWTKASTPGAPQQQLGAHFAGDWTVKSSMWMDPSAPPMVSEGRAVNTAEFGGRHVRSRYTGTFMGAPFQGEALTSYDNTKGKFVNLWIDSVNTGQYFSVGDYDAATRSYVFRGEMSDPTKPDKKTAMRDVLKVVDKDHYTMESYEVRDGKETRMMQLEYTRAAP